MNPHESPQKTYDKVVVCQTDTASELLSGTSIVVLRLEPGRLHEMNEAMRWFQDQKRALPGLLCASFDGLGAYFECYDLTPRILQSNDPMAVAWFETIRALNEAKDVACGNIDPSEASEEARLLTVSANAADGLFDWIVLPAYLFPEDHRYPAGPRIRTADDHVELSLSANRRPMAAWVAYIKHSSDFVTSASFSMEDVQKWLQVIDG